MCSLRKRVLVVDDDAPTRHIISDVLMDSCEVLEASNGTEAIRQALLGNPDCIVLDLKMPELGGYVVCEILRQIEKTRLIPIIVVSGKCGPADHRLALEIGATAFLSKPFKLEELRGSVISALANRPRERRRDRRLAAAVPIRVEGLSSDRAFQIHTTTEDISSRGLRFYGEFEACLGDLVRVSLLTGLPDQETVYVGKARTVWLDNRYKPLLRCGAEFIETSNRWLLRYSGHLRDPTR